MKFSIKQSLLLEALNVAGKCISEKPSIPAAGNFLFDLNGSTVTISACDISKSISYRTEIVSEQVKAKIQIPGRRLQGLISGLPEQYLEFEVSKNKNLKIEGALFLKITASSGTYEMPAEAGDDYPEIKLVEEASFYVKTQDLHSGIDKTSFACLSARDSPRVELKGVNLSFDERCLRFAATNTHIISTFSYPTDVTSDSNFIVPASAVAILRGLPAEESIRVIVSDTAIAFCVSDEIRLCAIQAHGRYPNFMAVIPFANAHEAIIDRLELISSLKRLVQFANPITKLVVFSFSEGACGLSASSDLGDKAAETISVQYTSPDTAIGFNAGQVLDVLTRMEKEHVRVLMGDPKKAVIFTENPNLKTLKSNLVVVMPLVINL